MCLFAQRYEVAYFSIDDFELTLNLRHVHGGDGLVCPMHGTLHLEDLQPLVVAISSDVTVRRCAEKIVRLVHVQSRLDDLNAHDDLKELNRPRLQTNPAFGVLVRRRLDGPIKSPQGQHVPPQRDWVAVLIQTTHGCKT